VEMILQKHGATHDGGNGSMVNLRVLKVDLPEIQGKQRTVIM